MNSEMPPDPPPSEYQAKVEQQLAELQAKVEKQKRERAAIGARQFYLEQREILVAYIQMKVDSGDYHGVRDACVDIEVLDARIEVLKAHSYDSQKS